MPSRTHLRITCRYLGLLLTSLAACATAWTAQAMDATAYTVDETSRTEAAVLAVEHHWTHAEGIGDTAWLERMLLPEYRSVNNDGTAHPKSAIVAGAAKNRGSDKGMKEIDAYLKTHPFGTSVVMHYNLAIVSFYVPKLGAQKGVTSSDIFLYLDGQWHAIYSQHTQAGKD